MSTIFISHVEEDASIALEIAAGLEGAGYTTWYYERDSLPGPSYLSQILAAIARCSAVVIVISPQALGSWQVDKEVVQAHEHGLPFLPVLRGLSHEEMHTRRPEWAMAFGAAVSLPLSPDGVAPMLARLIEGLHWLERGQPAPSTSRSALAAPVAATPADVTALGTLDTTVSPQADLAASQPAPAAQRPTPQAPLPLARTWPADTLPAQTTPLLGREREVAAVGDLLRRSEVRLVTLTGPAGVGKTRLGLQVATELRDTVAGRVYFVALAPIADAALVATTIAGALEVVESGGEALVETLMSRLRERPTLLVLDNFEQVIAAAPLVATLLAGCPLLKVLVTSRAALRLRGEHEVAVAPLAWPDLGRLPALEILSQYAAVALFIERAQEVKAEFTITTANAPAVAEICHRLDGLPLAIELAAARAKTLSPQALLARLERRLPLLTGGARDLPERQQTLRGAIDWSYDLLDAGEQALFRRLAVFVGACTLEDAAAVCTRDGTLGADILGGLESLVDKSLLRQDDEAADGEPRFGLLQTIREYGLERLEQSGEATALRHQHAAHYLALAERAEPELKGADQLAWLASLEQEHDNLRAALQWARESGETELGLRLATALHRFWLVRGHLSEGRAWLEDLLAQQSQQSERDDAVRARALNAAGSLVRNQGDHRRARTLHEESLALERRLGHKEGIAVSLNSLGIALAEQGDYAPATEMLEEALALFRELGDTWSVSTMLGNLAQMAQDQGDYERARGLHDECLALKRQLGDKRGIAYQLHSLWLVARGQGASGAAAPLLEESAALFGELRDRAGSAQVLDSQAIVAEERGDLARAAALHAQSLALAREIGDKMSIASGLEGEAVVAGARGEAERAARLLAAAQALHDAVGAPLALSERARIERASAVSRVMLGDVAFEAAWAAGRALPLEHAVAEALQPEAAPTKTPAPATAPIATAADGTR